MALFTYDTATICRERDNILSFAREKLSDEHQRVFAEHFMLSFVNPDDQFPISGEKAMEWLGYITKNKFKTFVQKNLQGNIHYQISLVRRDEHVHGGQNYELIKLSIEGFKILEMLARTDRGKIIRSYYPQLEKIIMDYCFTQYQLTLQEANERADKEKQMNENLRLTLKAERSNFAHLSNRGIIKGEKAQGVYICQTTDGSKVKIGMTKNGYIREDAIKNGNIDAKIVYMKATNNMRILEKLIHHILHEYRIIATREWFSAPYDVAKCAVDSAALFMDGLLYKCSSIADQNFYEKLKELIDSLPSSSLCPEILPEEDMEKTDNEEQDSEEEETTAEIDEKDPLDFNRFIDECCIKGDSLTCHTAELYGAHRLWARVNEKQAHDALYEYLCQNFKKTRVYNEDIQALLASFKGIALKPLTYEKDNPPSDIDQFIEERMKIGYSYRASTKEIVAAFAEWKKQTIPDYTMTTVEKRRIDHEFNKKFLGSTVFNGKHGVYGFFGVTFKECNTFVGMKLAPKLKKKIIKIDMNTQEIVETFQSLTVLSKTLRKNPSRISQSIRFKKPIDNFIYRYVENEES
jgi:hypothetical protein